MQSLPFELLENIGALVERLEDRKSLRRTFTTFGHALKPYVLAEVTLNIYKGNLQPGFGLLGALVNQPEQYSGHVRTLNILSLSPLHYPDPDSIYKKFDDSYAALEWKSDCDYDSIVEWVSDGQNAPLHEMLKTLLGPAVKSLHKLEEIRWHWHSKDSSWTLETLAASLSTLRNIRAFTFRYTLSRSFKRNSAPTFLPNLPELKTLSISASQSGKEDVSVCEVVKDLANHLLPQTMSLSSLHLDTGAWSFSLPLSQVYDEFDHSNLSHLGLMGWPVRTDDLAFLSASSNLTSLELHRVGNGDLSGPVFKLLASNGIKLRRLVTDFVTEKTLDYLESYSGLEVLSLKCHRKFPWIFFELAERFYQKTLPLHQDTLLQLDVQAVFVGLWCFSESNVESIRQCRNLQSLSMNITPQGIHMQPESQLERVLFPAHEKDAPNLVRLLLNMINSSLPRMQTLYVDWARPTVTCSGRTSSHKTPNDFCICNNERAIAYCKGARKRIRASIECGQGEVGSRGLDDRSVLRWVKMYVGGQRVIEKDVSEQTVKKRSVSESVKSMMSNVLKLG
ncbi:hypothetical protein K435DRAFT_968874 [Dendrothele bispora CBS 962.96]|uniref:Uncharacterized protein n=1 Tax=Dendrothele bispora (strain CBS 962.96) TaxID=1314807 RepID=A0A4S8LL66_DENBC|nr:hypothetical protein K435DRAFT_968874 [Dendrothele bispora CBS 962.96]